MHRYQVCVSSAPHNHHRGTWGGDAWLQTSIPAFTGPHASYPWIKVLRQLAHDGFPQKADTPLCDVGSPVQRHAVTQLFQAMYIVPCEPLRGQMVEVLGPKIVV
jgi:hypothetical protein